MSPNDRPSQDEPSRPAVPHLSGTQRRLVDALRRSKGAIADRPLAMYFAALHALQRNETNEDVHVAGYELREMMGAFAKVTGVVAADHFQLLEKVRPFARSWGDGGARSSCRGDRVWEGQIDPVLAGFLGDAVEFFQWFSENAPTRREESDQVLSALRPVDAPSPAALRSMATSKWSGLLRYFNKVAHHNITPSQAEVADKLAELEELLLEQVDPMTVEGQDALDAIIAEVEGPRAND